MELTRETRLVRRADAWVGSFDAMASPCEILIDSADSALAERVLETCAREAWRIEQKFSRYRDDSVLHRIHTNRGRKIRVDEETALLLDFAERCHELSEGRFDITSGVLRRVWRFDGSDRLPTREAVESVRALVGWEKVEWGRPYLILPANMEIDFGGFGKEYAVDRALDRVEELSTSPVLINFGGDLRANRPREDGRPWQIGIESPSTENAAPAVSSHSSANRCAPGNDEVDPVAVGVIALTRGGLATSGDSRRFLLRDGVRYSHILDPRTGWPVARAPRSVTVAAGTCVEAGTLATFAMLQGENAETFLSGQGSRFWCLR